MNKAQGETSKRDLVLKLSKSISVARWILIAVGVVLLILTIYFALSYFGAVGERKDVDRKITQKHNQINSAGELQNIAALQSQLESVLEDLEENSLFPTEVSNTEVAYFIIQAAKEASITCYQYAPSNSATFTINDHAYLENGYSISSSGATDSTGEKIVRITSFLEELEEAYDTSRISGLEVSDSDMDDQWTVNFRYAIIYQPSQ